MGTRIRRVARRALALALGGAVAAAIGEAAVRALTPEPVLPRFVVDAGYGVRANAREVDTVHSTPGEYRVAIHTNTDGLRGTREFELARAAHTYRVALLGDSFAFGYGVEDDEVVAERMRERLEQTLVGAPGPDGTPVERVEVLNFAVAGFGQAEQLVTYEHKVRAYKPDLVIVFYFDNDIGNDAVSGLFRVEDDGALTRTEAAYLPGVRAREVLYAAPPVRWLIEHSQLWNLIRNRASRFVQDRLLSREGLNAFNDTNDKAVALHRAVFLALLEAVRRDGAESGVFVVPLRTMETNFAFDDDELAEHTRFVVRGTEVVTTDDYYTRDGHWRASGHAKAAAALEREILAHLSSPEQP